MDRDQIVKALECCIEGEDCEVCPLFNERCCPVILNENALALIKSQEQRIRELTAKVAKWEEECDLRGDMWCKLNEENKRLTKENERLRAENENKCKDCAGCISDKCDCANIEAYTVEKLLDCAIDNAVCKDNGDGTEILFISIPKLREIAKEMLEGGNER